MRLIDEWKKKELLTWSSHGVSSFSVFEQANVADSQS